MRDRVGWRVESSWIYYSKVTFDTSSPRGHLPLFLRGEEWVVSVGSELVSSLASRLVNSNI
ncbi:GUN4 domain-containing protein [Nostoc sp. UHCC 0252]|uniref:GUN4 domain-containing protein n=1 Tax=Nostoc sp. UHCC 0252 TaxID=3110241 RepID=UPI002B1E9476|nr:GUN4 domain-containing protein [Nostoc sp. UHCC 0252]MEA5605423.1 GUN4 domain-containing protein [Nostoc sp. UHCC 0252]